MISRATASGRAPLWAALVALVVTLPAGAKAPPQADAILGTLYAPAREIVARYCAGCHTKAGRDPKQRRAYPAQHLDTYSDWANHAAVLREVLDRGNPDVTPMPPKGARAQPTDAERRLLIDWIDRGSPNTPSGK